MRKPWLYLLLCWVLFGVSATTWAIAPEQLLQPDEAFQFNAELKDADNLLLTWNIADGYYLYRQKFKFVSLSPDIKIGEPVLPEGLTKQDKHFGTVKVYRTHLEAELPIRRQLTTPKKLVLEVTFQGCADAGVCYMPIQKVISLDLPEPAITGGSDTFHPNQQSPFIAEHDRIAASLTKSSAWLTILSFLGFGLLLAFTPCILPMIPIISGIVAGHGEDLTTQRAFTLSLSYVLASALTYSLFGMIAGLFGSNLQALFQLPWVILIFSGIFVLLALSLFGVFRLRFPFSLQYKIAALGAKYRGGHLLGAAAMGMFSTLAVGPCVTAPLAGVLLFIGQSGNPVLGGLALFALGLGMGMPLLIIGTSAGKLLPKAGPWMNIMHTLFGLGLLAVAIWLLERILTPAASGALWALLLLGPLLYLIGRKRWKNAAWVFSLYGVIGLLAGIAQQRDLMQLLCNTAAACQTQVPLVFEKISSIEELHRKLGAAHAKTQWVVLDIYADWCISCQEMERYTLSDPRIREALSHVALLKADVTQNLATDQTLLKQFNLIGPPAILFFAPDQRERTAYRIVGYIGVDQFLDITRHLFDDSLS
ncbi:MAG: protein-disulfide reductase DsbD [Methylococcaceae bacterium]|nr:protein-disulfide reductase DsbD [Methylococcaceae bacterium]